ncbi:hypothetical protein MANES_08G144500v8 [Manihot esculenta]|uniref:Uncharacterized protein n=1 Tax=Manihot esculenta TaxID=3983 RepID=A0ACB7HCG9_MANES|nr:hypothetical protein MANES_08G144500v8 [Manihot esculenta]
MGVTGKSTLECSLSTELHSRGKLSYVLDGDNLCHGLNKGLGFSAGDLTEIFADTPKSWMCSRILNYKLALFSVFQISSAGFICTASLISPYRKDWDVCSAMLADANFTVFMNMHLSLCESRDAKGLYKLALAEKIKGFTGTDDPYELPLNCEIEIKEKDGACPTASAMAGQVVSYLEDKGLAQDQ